eukprot:TRINITY_DN15565_c0_g1_i4.p1 TRINITY_DN15565_c0_g1~~TRINITY_DN15565_c0_g1_i4.p1  ORF type:complete len:228 (-),score=38.96 TRINITY_DN15565_c0_g1_i4:58-741(-)
MKPNDELAKKRFQKISEAYELLRDPVRRSQYDTSGRWSSSTAQQGASSAEDIFRNAAKDREVVMEAFQLYAEAVSEEAKLAADLIWQGKWTEAWPIIREHRALFAAVGVLALVLRFPAAVGAVLRFGAVALMHPAAFRTVVQMGLDRRVWAYAWGHLVQAAHRQRARLRQRARERHSQRQNQSPREPPPPGGSARSAEQPRRGEEPRQQSATSDERGRSGGARIRRG